MDIGHSMTMKVLQKFWDKYGVSLSAFETLSLIDWCHNYLKDLKNFGVQDVYLMNGMLNLCNAYSRKIHCQNYPKVVTILS
jgi:hypothetical protein